MSARSHVRAARKCASQPPQNFSSLGKSTRAKNWTTDSTSKYLEQRDVGPAFNVAICEAYFVDAKNVLCKFRQSLLVASRLINALYPIHCWLCHLFLNAPLALSREFCRHVGFVAFS